MNKTYEKGLNVICGGLDLSPIKATVAEATTSSIETFKESLIPDGPGGVVNLALALLSVGAGGYHGYKRNGDSLKWGAGWAAGTSALMVGSLYANDRLSVKPLGTAEVSVRTLPLLTAVAVPAIAVYQGFGKKAK